MPAHTPKTRGQFQSLKAQTMAALLNIFDREKEARLNGDEALGDALFAQRQDVNTRLVEIREAEIRFLLSQETIDDAIAALSALADELKRANDQLVSIQTALNAAARVVSVLTRLAGLFL